jgi:hypothetical protein
VRHLHKARVYQLHLRLPRVEGPCGIARNNAIAPMVLHLLLYTIRYCTTTVRSHCASLAVTPAAKRLANP